MTQPPFPYFGGKQRIDPSPMVAIPACDCSCHTMPGVMHVAACCNLSAADQGPTVPQEGNTT